MASMTFSADLLQPIEIYNKINELEDAILIWKVDLSTMTNTQSLAAMIIAESKRLIFV